MRVAGTGERSEPLAQLAAVVPAPAALEKWELPSPRPAGREGSVTVSIRLSAEVSKGRTWLYRNHAQWRGARLLVSDHSSSNPKSSAVLYN